MQSRVQARGIQFLYHFTQESNLTSIAQHGLLPRQVLQSRNIPAAVNDPYRLDGTDAICASIGHPNYKMWHPLKTESPATSWVVIAINPSVLWERQCAYCVTNAASAGVTQIPLQQRTTLAAFDAMFFEREGKATRAAMGLSDGFPTDPQAEVLILDGVPRQYIAGVYTKTDVDKRRLQALFPTMGFAVGDSLWRGRNDYAHWR